MPDADIYKEVNRNKYEKYWKDEIEKLKADLKEMDSDGILKRNQVIIKYEEIIKSIPLMLDFLDKRNSLTYQILLDENFISLYNSIEDKIKKDLEI
jgi:internalin A